MRAPLRLKVHKLNNWKGIMDGFKSNRVPILYTRVTFRIYLLKHRQSKLIKSGFIFAIFLIVILTINKSRKLYQSLALTNVGVRTLRFNATYKKLKKT